MTTRDANLGESGQPWLMPSSMSRVYHVLSAHLWWTVPACSWKRAVSRSILGNDFAMTLKKTLWETLLN